MSYIEFINIFPKYNFLEPLFEKDLIHSHTYDKGEIIITFNQKLSNIYFFISGRGRAYRTLNNGKEVIYSTYGSGDIAGDLEFITNTSTTCNIINSDKLTCYKLPMSLIDVNIFFETYKLFSGEVARKFVTNSMRTSIQLGYNLEDRVAHYCLYEYNNDVFSMDELAGFLGTTYRHLSRVLKKFSDSGFIKVENRNITIKDIKSLEKLSEFIRADFLIE